MFSRNVLKTKCINEGHLSHNEVFSSKIALKQNNCCVYARVLTIYSTRVRTQNSALVPRSPQVVTPNLEEILHLGLCFFCTFIFSFNTVCIVSVNKNSETPTDILLFKMQNFYLWQLHWIFNHILSLWELLSNIC